MSDEEPMGDIDEILVEVCARPPHTAFLVIHYDGTQPPRALFADLAAAGWDPPAFAPPPRSAIDWSTRDARTGTSFSVRPYRVDDAVVEPPAGSGPRGSWTPDERRTFAAQLAAVLARHGPAVEDPGRILPIRAPSSTDIAALPPPPGTRTPSPSGLPPGTTVRMLTDVSPDRLDEFAGACVPLGVTPRLSHRIETRVETFRGSTNQRRIQVPIVDVLVPVERVAAADALLADLGATATWEIVEDEQLAADANPSRAVAGPDATTERHFPPGTIRATLLLTPRAVPLLADHLPALDLLHHEIVRTTRTVTSTYRGSVQSHVHPAVRLRVWVDPADAVAVVRILAAAGGVNVDDPEQVVLEEVDHPSAAEPAAPPPPHPTPSSTARPVRRRAATA